jgi:hypothetical protein
MYLVVVEEVDAVDAVEAYSSALPDDGLKHSQVFVKF